MECARVCQAYHKSVDGTSLGRSMGPKICYTKSYGAHLNFNSDG